MISLAAKNDSDSTPTVTVAGVNNAPNTVNDVFTTNAGFDDVASGVWGVFFDKRLLRNDGWFTIYEDGSVDFEARSHFESLAEGESVVASMKYSVGDNEEGMGTATLFVTVENTKVCTASTKR